MHLCVEHARFIMRKYNIPYMQQLHHVVHCTTTVRNSFAQSFNRTSPPHSSRTRRSPSMNMHSDACCIVARRATTALRVHSETRSLGLNNDRACCKATEREREEHSTIVRSTGAAVCDRGVASSRSRVLYSVYRERKQHTTTQHTHRSHCSTSQRRDWHDTKAKYSDARNSMLIQYALTLFERHLLIDYTTHIDKNQYEIWDFVSSLTASWSSGVCCMITLPPLNKNQVDAHADNNPNNNSNNNNNHKPNNNCHNKTHTHTNRVRNTHSFCIQFTVYSICILERVNNATILLETSLRSSSSCVVWRHTTPRASLVECGVVLCVAVQRRKCIIYTYTYVHIAALTNK